VRLTLVTASSTAATASAAFPADEPVDARGAGWVSDARPRIGRHDAARTGPAQACRQTAAGLGLAVDVDDGLRDWDHGRWQGMGLDAVAAAEPAGFAAWTIDADATPHGGESLTAVLARVAAWLADLPDEGSLIAVAPVAVVRAAVVVALCAPSSAFWRHDPAPLTATVLRGSARRWTLRCAGAPLVGGPGRSA
jgi:broad specificity phosphatase PhoE